MVSPTFSEHRRKSQRSEAVEKDLGCHCLCDDPSFQGGLCKAKLVFQSGRRAPQHSRPCCYREMLSSGKQLLSSFLLVDAKPVFFAHLHS